MAHDPRNDWRTHLGRHEGRAAHDILSDQTTVLKFLLKLPFLPFMLPFYIRRMMQRKKELKDFAMERARNRLVNDELIKNIAVEWAESHPNKYPLGEYDPGLQELRQTFKKILANRSRR